MLRAAFARAAAPPRPAAGLDEERATFQSRKCFSCNLELLPSQVHTCHKCKNDIHGKIIADTLGICVVTQLASDDSVLFCKECSASSNKLVDKSVKTAVKTGEAAFAATALAPSKEPQATGSNTARLCNKASSTKNAFNFLMARRGPASITGAPANGIASILIVEVDNGIAGTAPRDSSQSASVPAVPAVPAVASPPLGFLEKLDCTVILKNDVAEESIPLNVLACLAHVNLDLRKTYKELGIFFKSALTVQCHPLSITC